MKINTLINGITYREETIVMAITALVLMKKNDGESRGIEMIAHKMWNEDMKDKDCLILYEDVVEINLELFEFLS